MGFIASLSANRFRSSDAASVPCARRSDTMSTRHNIKRIRAELSHADMRGALTDIVSAYEDWEEGEAEPTIELGGRHVPISAACRLLSNYSDLMPNRVSDWVREF